MLTVYLLPGAGGFPNPFYGTSASSPHLAAVCGLLLDQNPGATPAEIINYLANSAVDKGSSGFDNTFGYGLADVFSALLPWVSSVEVKTSLTVDVTFSESMGSGVSVPGNYTVSGSGKGTLSTNPDSVAYQGSNTYRLTWNSGGMVNGGNVTVTVSNVQDIVTNPIGTPNSGTDVGGGISPQYTLTINTSGGGSVTKDPDLKH